MNYFNERFRQIKHSELPTISGPNGNVGMKCLPQPFNNFLDPAGGFTFYPNFNYSRIFDNDVRNCRNSNYLPAPVHGTANIKQAGSPFCYHSGMPSTLYQNCYHNSDPKTPHHPNFFYPPNFYPHPQPSRVTPPTEFPEASKALSLHAEASRPAHLSNHESNGNGRSSASSVVSVGQSSSRNCSYIPHRPFQNQEALFWNSLNPSNLQKYQEKNSSEGQLTQKNVSDSAVIGNKGQGHVVGSQSERSNNVTMEGSSIRHHVKSGSHKKSSCATSSQLSTQSHNLNKRLRTEVDFSCESDIQAVEADSQSSAERSKVTVTSLANSSEERPVMPEESDWEKASVSGTKLPSTSSSTSIPPLPQPSLLPTPKSKHRQQNLKLGPIKCPLCGEQLQSNEELDLHLRSHVDSMPPPDLSLARSKIQGDGKKKASKKGAKVDNDMKGEEGLENKAKPLCQCVGCQKTFTRVDKLKLHVSKRHPELLQSFYKCPHCQQGFEKCLALKQHLKTSHSGLLPKTKIKPQYTCDECGELLSSRRDLVYHSMGHSGESPLHCPECGGRFTRPDKLKRHMFIHTGELPFTCSRCGQGFSRTDRLKEHTRLAHNESLLKCPSCDRVFDTWLQVKHHLKSHEYTCEECGESFTRKRKLQFHVMAHRTEKLLRCSECGIRFGHPSRLKKHIEFVHNSKVPLGRASISDPQNNSEDASKIKVEPGCEPTEKIEDGDEDLVKVESWSYRLRRVEDLKKPQVVYVNKTEDLDAEDYDDDIEGDDDGDDGSYEYDCRRGFNQKRKKKKKRSKLGRKFTKLHHFNGKLETKDGIVKVGISKVHDATMLPQLTDIKKDIGESEVENTASESVGHGKKMRDISSCGLDNDYNEEDDDTDVGEVSAVYCSICYLSFGNREELVQHSGEHLLDHPIPPYNGLPCNGTSQPLSDVYHEVHHGFAEAMPSSNSAKSEFEINQNIEASKRFPDADEPANSKSGVNKVNIFTGQKHVSSGLISTSSCINSSNYQD